MKKFILPLFVLSLCSCLQNPIPPSWDTEINLPLATKHILMRSEYPDSVDSVTLVKEEYAIDTIWAKDVLVLDSIVQDTVLAFNELNFNLSYKDTFNYVLGEVIPALRPFHGQTVSTIDSAYFDTTGELQVEDFDFVVVDSGYIWLQFVNSLPVVIESLIIKIPLSDTVTFNFYQINEGDTITDTRPLNGKTIQKPIIYIANMWTREKTTPTMIDTTVNVSVNTELFIRTLRSMTGFFPPCTTNTSIGIPLSPYGINSAQIDSGFFQFILDNPIQGEFDFFVEDIAECNFLNLRKTMVNGINDTTIGIINGTINPLNPDSLRLNTWFYPTTGTVWNTLDSTDTFKVRIRIFNIHVSAFSGFFGDTVTATFPAYNRTIDYQGVDPTVIHFDSVLFYARIYNGININPTINLNITGTRTSQPPQSLSISRVFPPRAEDSMRLSGDSVVNFVNLFPETINATGQAMVYGPVSVIPTDFITGAFGFEVPLRVVIDDTLSIEPDTAFGVEIPKQVRDMPIESTKIVVRYINPTDLMGEARIYLSADSASQGECVFFTRFNTNGTYTTITPIAATDYLANEKVWTRIGVKLFSQTMPDTITVLPRDKFCIKALLKVKVRVKPGG